MAHAEKIGLAMIGMRKLFPCHGTSAATMTPR
jgi:hypothetical protein